MCILYSVIGLQNNIIYDVLVNVRGQHVRPAFFKDWSLVQACSSALCQSRAAAGATPTCHSLTISHWRTLDPHQGALGVGVSHCILFAASSLDRLSKAVHRPGWS